MVWAFIVTQNKKSLYHTAWECAVCTESLIDVWRGLCCSARFVRSHRQPVDFQTFIWDWKLKKKDIWHHSNNIMHAFCWWEVLMSRPACDPQWVYHPSHRELSVGDRKWHWHVLVFTALLCCCDSRRAPSLADACHLRTAGRWGPLLVHLCGSSAPGTGPCCPEGGRLCCCSTWSLGFPAAHAHKQRWPAWAHSRRWILW